MVINTQSGGDGYAPSPDPGHDEKKLDPTKDIGPISALESAKPVAAEQIKPAVDVDDLSDDELTKRQKFKEEAISVLKLLGTNSALIVMVAAYCAVGGVIFNQLEQPNEIAECKATREVYRKSLAEAVDKIDFLSANLQLSDQERSDLYSETMDELRREFQSSGWDTRDCDKMVPKWSWMGAFFFCLTVVSTIGYGQIAPKTQWGRIVVMFYAIVGLPIMVMTLASVGNVLASVFKWLYNMVCCCGCCVRHRKARVRIKPPAIMWRVNADGKPIGDGPSVLAEDSDSELEDEAEVNIPLTVSLMVIALSLIIGAVIFSNYENWTFLDAAYFSFVSLATIGFGDLVPDFDDATSLYDQGKMVVTWVFLVFGMALVSMCLQMMQNEVAQKIKWLSSKFKMEKEQKSLQEQLRKQEAKEEKRQIAVEDGHQDNEEEEADDEDEEVAPMPRPLTSSKPNSSARPRTGKSARPRTGAQSGVARGMTSRPLTSRRVEPIAMTSSGLGSKQPPPSATYL